MINQVILIGNLGANPEQKNADNGTIVSKFSIATSRHWKDSNNQSQQETEWHRIVAFGRLAEICGQYLVKGSKVYLEGRLQTQKWQDRDGNTRYTTEIVARTMKMLDGKPEEGGEETTFAVPFDNEVIPF